MLNIFGQLFLHCAMLNKYSKAVDHPVSSTVPLATAVTPMYMQSILQEELSTALACHLQADYQLYIASYTV